MTKKKMIALDLDGTLLRSDNTISDYTVETLKKIQEKGHKVVIATGRPYRMALEHYKRLELETPMISFNGSLTHLPEKKWDFEHSVTIDKKYILDVLDLQQSVQADFIASEYRKNSISVLKIKKLLTQNFLGWKKLQTKWHLILAKSPKIQMVC